MSETTTTETTPKKKSASRAEAGLVEENFEAQPNDEAIAEGEAFSEEALEEGAPLVETAQSGLRVSGMSEEEQNMNMTPVIVGPPGYGSPNPITAAGRLLPLDQHPFNPNNLPDDHPARVDENYGKGYDADLTPTEIGTSFPGAPQRTDLENDMLGAGGGEAGATVQGEEQAAAYDAQTKDELLAEAQARGLSVTSSNTKAEIISALQEDDATAP